MRLRRRPETPAKMARYSEFYLVEEASAMKGKWQALFGNDQPIHLEIGCGKGRFVLGLAALNPDINYVAMELHEEVIAQALKRAAQTELKNVRFIRENANRVPEIFEEGEIHRVYLNFSDPWPKARHYKRRLTYRGYLKLYSRVLKTGGELHFKTDNLSLFEFSLNEFAALNLPMKAISLDLHRKPLEGDVKTEYEEKFSALGFKINRVEVNLDSLKETK